MSHWTLNEGVPVAEERRKEKGAGALVVDDDAPIRALITAALRHKEVRTESCANGEDAINCLGQEKWKALILDLMMPGVNGWDVINWLGENPDHKPHTVIVVTAADRRVVRELNPDVVNAVIFKPFDVFDLASYVDSCIRHDLPVDRRKRRVVH